MTQHLQRVNLILNHRDFTQTLEKIRSLEQNRKFCRHNIEHLLDTARIMYITSLEQNLGIDKELIYATALLHDIGRADEYEGKAEHDIAGAELAKNILADCGFSADEISQICSAILCHRDDDKAENPLGRLLYFADKRSRLCLSCCAKDECYWTDSKKNLDIIV